MDTTEPEQLSTIDKVISTFYAPFSEYTTLFIVLEVAFYLILVGVALELIWDYKIGKRKGLGGLKEPAVNFSFLLGAKVVEATKIFTIIYASTYLFGQNNALFNIPINAFSWIVCLLLVDLTYYWVHRIEHTVRIFWTTHSVHHSSHEYDLTTSFRIFWFLDIILWAFFIPLIFIGFSGVQVLSCMVVVFTFMTWIHTEHVGRIPVFERIFNTPSFHRVHHGMNRQYIDKNFAGMFVIWDYIFGTYEPEVEQVQYGLTKPINTSNPIKVGFNEFIELGRDLKAADGLKNKVLILFKGPGWKPQPKEQAASSAPTSTGQTQETAV